MKNILIIISGIVLVIGGIYIMISSSEEDVDTFGQENVQTEYDKAPQFSLKDYDGNVVSFSDFSGKVSVINSWATWCPFCVNELPAFGELQEEFGDKIVVVAIDRNEPLEKAKKFTDSLGVTDKMIFLLDPKDSFYRSIGAFSMPETIFVDGDGNIRLHKRGPMELSEMITIINNIINI